MNDFLKAAPLALGALALAATGTTVSLVGKRKKRSTTATAEEDHLVQEIMHHSQGYYQVRKMQKKVTKDIKLQRLLIPHYVVITKATRSCVTCFTVIKVTLSYKIRQQNVTKMLKVTQEATKKSQFLALSYSPSSFLEWPTSSRGSWPLI